MKPFLKWAGGKHRLVERITRSLPKGGRLIEPFVGSGAVFLGAEYDTYLLGDANADLIHLYTLLKHNPDALLREVEGLFRPELNDQIAYYELREEFNSRDDDVRKSALFVYLNRHCFNGLCRYNAKGKFNVPFGRYTSPTAPLKELVGFSEKSQHAEFVHEDFRDVMSYAKTGDVVYCDPPYVPLSATANFTSYATTAFGLQEQEALATLAAHLSAKGIPVLISNHDTPLTRELYAAAEIHAFPVQRFISRDAANRKAADELLALFA